MGLVRRWMWLAGAVTTILAAIFVALTLSGVQDATRAAGVPVSCVRTRNGCGVRQSPVMMSGSRRSASVGGTISRRCPPASPDRLIRISSAPSETVSSSVPVDDYGGEALVALDCQPVAAPTVTAPLPPALSRCSRNHFDPSRTPFLGGAS